MTFSGIYPASSHGGFTGYVFQALFLVLLCHKHTHNVSLGKDRTNCSKSVTPESNRPFWSPITQRHYRRERLYAHLETSGLEKKETVKEAEEEQMEACLLLIIINISYSFPCDYWFHHSSLCVCTRLFMYYCVMVWDNVGQCDICCKPTKLWLQRKCGVYQLNVVFADGQR